MAKKWTLRSKLIPMLRRLFFYSPLRREALKGAKVPNKNKYKCKKCKKLFILNQVTVDHIKPIIDRNEGFPTTTRLIYYLEVVDDWTSYVHNLFCGLDNLQVLCKKCHDRKTKDERKRAKRKTSKR